MKIIYKLTMALLLCSVIVINSTRAENDSSQTFELSSEHFVSDAFDGNVPAAKRVWIRGELKKQLEVILQHRATFLRVKYWKKNNRSVWMIDEIGKEKPITSGIIVSHENGVSKIHEVQVLAFRETRGWEVKYSFFTDQFKGLYRSIKNKSGLNQAIDGITGATLSVRALKKSAEIALILDEHVRQTKAD